MLTWLIAFLAISYFIGDFISQSTSPTQISKPKQESSQQATSPPIEQAPEPKWAVTSSIDEMTGQQMWYAKSPVTEATVRMDFPYSNTVSNLQVGCSQSTLMVYFYFSNEPNLIDDKTKDGYNWISTRIKWNDELLTSHFTQEWTSNFIHFADGKDAIKRISSSDTVMLELNWAGSGLVRFPYSLKGSTKALNELKSHCGEME